VIIFRYLFRELITTTAAVCAILLMVVMSGRFVKYLAQAVSGSLDPEILFALIGYRIPGFVELILPLAFFLAILLALGRLYVESEMTVLTACGISTRRLVSYVLLIGALLAVVTGWLSLYVSPAGAAKADALLDAQKQRSELDGLNSRRFYRLHGQRGVTYIEEVSSDVLKGIFLAESHLGRGNSDGLVLVLAETGRSLRDTDNKNNLLLLERGVRIQGEPGRADFQITRFDEYGQQLDKPQSRKEKFRGDTIPTEQLLGSLDIKDKAVLQWRLSVPILLMVVTLMAIPLSRTDPRQGRFLKMLPAVLLYIIYLVVLSAVRGKMEGVKYQLCPAFGGCTWCFLQSLESCWGGSQ